MATAPKRKTTAKKATRKTATKRKTASRPKASYRPANKGSQGQWVLITGASAGIGEALAGKFAAGGFDLVLAARSKDKLAKLGKKLSAEHGIATEVAQIDLSKPGAPRDLFNEMASRGIDIDVLVNNAGVLEMGPFKSQEPETLGDMIRLNTVALTELAALFVPPMAKRKSGRVLNVASVASFQPVPSLAVYAGTKAFVLSLTESLAEELKSDGVTVTALCPGITETNMFGTIKSSNERTERIPSFLVGDVQEVAQEGYDACIKGDVVRVPGLAYAMTTSIGRASPRWLTRLVAGAIGRQMM
ncbi:short-chain dehydrogenase/reductase SDR [Candidatus Phaeomarinobacter ectocarpi]|uniref:Short-chain dehydrogenase/reductase SDR n=1 Tax=Candidatus Phaeomarinibacter ectocarpi TaxID=1458461 RepID=X5MDN6_9HYPH|nr:SDR family oxidoreductase [Candidatus Phaeomarinobacter ectocarpi]CDO60332.1 short-chain dehydrogenase/reductase SDR [Candidatus Phaeomarinobacter ectocarpi]